LTPFAEDSAERFRGFLGFSASQMECIQSYLKHIGDPDSWGSS